MAMNTRRTIWGVTALLSLAMSCAQYEGPIPPVGEIRQPVGVAVHPSGDFIYVVNSNFSAEYRLEDGGSVSVIDADTLEVIPERTVRVGSYGAKFAFLGDDPAQPSHLALAVRSDNSVVVLDLAEDGGNITCQGTLNSTPCRVLDLPADPYAITYINNEAELDAEARSFAVVSLSGRVAIVTLRDGTVDTAEIEPAGVVGGANTLLYLSEANLVYILGRFSNNLLALTWVRDAGGSIEALVSLGTAPIVTPGDFSEVRDAAFSSDRSTIFATTNRPDSLISFRVTRDASVSGRALYGGRIDIDGRPSDLRVVHERGHDVLYVALADGSAIHAVDPRTGFAETVIPLAGLPFAMAHDPVRQRLYVSLFDADAVAVIDIDPQSPAFRTVRATITSSTP